MDRSEIGAVRRWLAVETRAAVRLYFEPLRLAARLFAALWRR